jgi:hypothetical protein
MTRTVTLTEAEIAGSCIAIEQRGDSTLVLQPADSKRSETEDRARELAERHPETLDYLAEH